MQTHLVVAVNRFFRESPLRRFRGGGELRVSGAVELLPQIGERVPQLNPQVVVLDPEPGYAAFSAARAIRQAAPRVKILMIGVRDDPEMFPREVRAGAVGYLLRDAPPRRMLVAARRFGRNSIVCPEHLMLALFRALGDGSPLAFGIPEGARGLTPRDQQLAGSLMQGLGNREIADPLHLSLRAASRPSAAGQRGAGRGGGGPR